MPCLVNPLTQEVADLGFHLKYADTRGVAFGKLARIIVWRVNTPGCVVLVRPILGRITNRLQQKLNAAESHVWWDIIAFSTLQRRWMW
jgi:hypothetical protein